jgi:hypothetical protein
MEKKKKLVFVDCGRNERYKIYDFLAAADDTKTRTRFLFWESVNKLKGDKMIFW